MPLANAQFGDLADRPEPGPSHKGVFYVDEDENIYLCDGEEWDQVGGGGGGAITTLNAITLAGGGLFQGQIAAGDNGYNAPFVTSSQPLPVVTNPMLVSVDVSIPTPEFERAGYTGPIEIFEALEVAHPNLSLVGALTRRTQYGDQPSAVPGSGFYSDYSEWAPGKGIQMSRKFIVPANGGGTVQIAYYLGLRSDGTPFQPNVRLANQGFTPSIGYQPQNVGEFFVTTQEIAA